MFENYDSKFESVVLERITESPRSCVDQGQSTQSTECRVPSTMDTNDGSE